MNTYHQGFGRGKVKQIDHYLAFSIWLRTIIGYDDVWQAAVLVVFLPVPTRAQLNPIERVGKPFTFLRDEFDPTVQYNTPTKIMAGP